MAFSISFYDGIKYHRQDFINRQADFFGNGLVRTTDFPLTFPSTPNMTATIGQGVAWVDGYRISNDTNLVTLNFNTADATNSRIDIIQLGHDDINSTFSLQVKQGVASASPIEPNPDPGYVKLYAVSVDANATSISSSNITDRRTLVPLNVSGSQIQTEGLQKNIYQQDSEPSNPQNDDLWINTSVTPNTWNRYYSTTGWVQIGTVAPVSSVNGKTGAVVLGASDVGAEPTITTKNTAFNKNFGTTTGTVADGGALNAHTTNTNNPHNVTASQVGAVPTTDFVQTVKYGVGGGSANAYTVTLTPAPTAYIDGMAISFSIPANSSGASTLNVNSLGAKTIKKSDGSDIIDDLTTGAIVTVRYNATSGNFILQGEGGLSSTQKQTLVDITNAAQANDTTMRGQFVSKMNADDTSLNLPSTASWNDILNAVDTMTNDFNAKINARKQFATGTAVSGGGGYITVSGSTGSTSYAAVSATGLPFQPTQVIAFNTSKGGNPQIATYWAGSDDMTNTGSQPISYTDGSSYINGCDTNSVFGATSNGFALPAYGSGNTWQWIAFG